MTSLSYVERAYGEATVPSVTVLVAPSAARAYGADFDGFPSLSEAPHVIDLSRSMGFEALNLPEAMTPYARARAALLS